MAYRLLRGKNGASGYVRDTADGREAAAEGLPAGAEAALYALEEQAARLLGRERADENGRAVWRRCGGGRLFIAAEGKVALWEAGERPEEEYLRCCHALRRLNAPAPSGETEKPPERREERPPSLPAEREPAVLRAASDAPPVNGLRELAWPRGTEEIRAYFDALPPITHFYAPGWRFVRAPSPLPGTAYCAVGRYARDGRVQRLAYALPGTPYRPPAELPGYRYRQGYWILETET